MANGYISDHFPSTHWSVIAQAIGDKSSEARLALQTLCRRYWYPVYVYVRRRFRDQSQAEDATQGFFEHILVGNLFENADPKKGTFRSYLITACRNYVLNYRRSERDPHVNGRPVRTIALDFQWAAKKFTDERQNIADPEAEFRRRWAYTILEQAKTAVGDEYRETGKNNVFEALKFNIGCGEKFRSLAEIAVDLGMNEVAVKKAAQRVRECYGSHVRRLVLDTVNGPSDVRNEIKELFESLQRF